MKPPKISVIIPSYNKVKYIDKTLSSIFAQNYPNLEVVIQDGASKDGTLKVIKKYAKRYPKIIKWESKEDRGQLNAVNNGMSKASGEIITFINADDLYEPNTFKFVSDESLKEPNALWFAGQGTVINENGKEIARPVTFYKNFLLRVNSYSLLLSVNYLIQPSIFITKGAYKKYGPFTGTNNFITEYDLWLRLGKVKMPKVINKNLTKFRIEPTTKTARMFPSLLAEDRKIIAKFTKNPGTLFLHDIHNFVRILIGRFL